MSNGETGQRGCTGKPFISCWRRRKDLKYWLWPGLWRVSKQAEKVEAEVTFPCLSLVNYRGSVDPSCSTHRRTRFQWRKFFVIGVIARWFADGGNLRRKRSWAMGYGQQAKERMFSGNPVLKSAQGVDFLPVPANVLSPVDTG